MVWAVSLSTTDLRTRRLTPEDTFMAFGVQLSSVTLYGPLAQSVLYLHHAPLEASPKAISGRTSYLRVRLAFHPYPHLIPALFNVRGFGPPAGATPLSPWTWVDHTVSGLRLRTLRPLQTRFRFGSASSA